MEKARRVYLLQNYTRKIFDDENYYQKEVVDAIRKRGSISLFRNLVSGIINKMQDEKSEKLSSKDFKFIEMRLFEQLSVSTYGLQIPQAWTDLQREIDLYDREPQNQSPETGLTNTTQSQLKEKDSMLTKPFVTKNFVFGSDVAVMTEDQLIDAIRNIEGQINSLNGIVTKSKKIAQRIKELEDALAKVVETLDAK